MTRYWTNFARTGDPNGADLPEWPEWGETHRLLRIDADPAAEAETDRGRFEFLDARTGGF